jgi:hypothetical protein
MSWRCGDPDKCGLSPWPKRQPRLARPSSIRGTRPASMTTDETRAKRLANQIPRRRRQSAQLTPVRRSLRLCNTLTDGVCRKQLAASIATSHHRRRLDRKVHLFLHSSEELKWSQSHRYRPDLIAKPAIRGPGLPAGLRRPHLCWPSTIMMLLSSLVGLGFLARARRFLGLP